MKGLACFGGGILLVAALVLGNILGGYVLVTMWGWFITPVFAVPAPSIALAIGLMFTISLFKGNRDSSGKKKEWAELWIDLIVAILSPLITLSAGWIVLRFV